MSALFEHLTDERLLADRESDLPGPRRRAEILLPIPPHARNLIVLSANRRRNMTGGRYSDALWAEAEAWKRGMLTEKSHAEDGRKFREMGY